LFVLFFGTTVFEENLFSLKEDIFLLIHLNIPNLQIFEIFQFNLIKFSFKVRKMQNKRNPLICCMNDFEKFNSISDQKHVTWFTFVISYGNFVWKNLCSIWLTMFARQIYLNCNMVKLWEPLDFICKKFKIYMDVGEIW
jgi:hypothetical protein